MKTSKRVIAAILFLLTARVSHGQFRQENSLEFLLTTANNRFGVVAADRDLVVFYELESQALMRKWEIAILNENLEMMRRTTFNMDMNFMVSHVKYFDGYTYLLLRDMNIPMKGLVLVRVNKKNGEYDTFSITDLLPDEIAGFEMVGDAFFLIGRSSSGPVVMRFKYGDPRPQVMKGVFNKKTRILHTKVISIGGKRALEVITKVKSEGGKNILFVKQFDGDGEILKTIRLNSSKGYHLLDAVTHTGPDGKICVAGTFSYKKSYQSNGLFTTVIDDKGEHLMYYYDFTRLHNYFDWMEPEKREKAKRKYTGENAAAYKTGFIPEILHKRENGWEFLGVSLKMKERNSRTYGYMWPMEYRQFSHAVILGIGEDGKLVWDNSFSLQDLATPSPRQQVFMYPFGDQTIVFYRNYFHLIYKVIDKGETVKGRTFFELKTKEKNYMYDKVKETGEIISWFDGYFVTFGSSDVMIENLKPGKMYILNKVFIDPRTLNR